MYRIVRITLAFAIGAGLTTTADGQGRHDEKPHGYDAKAAAGRTAGTPQDKYVVLPSGPRGQDNPLRGRRIAVTPKTIEAPPTNPASQAAERK